MWMLLLYLHFNQKSHYDIWYGINVEQDQTMCGVQEWQLCLSYFWLYLPLLYLTVIIHWFCVGCVSQRPCGIFLMILVRNVEQEQTTWCVQEWQLCLSYFWRYLPLLYLTVIIHWFRVCCNTLWNIFMLLGRNVEQDQRTCLVQEWQLCLSYFWHYLPLLYLTVIIHWYCVCSVSQKPFGIFLWYLVEM